MNPKTHAALIDTSLDLENHYLQLHRRAWYDRHKGAESVIRDMIVALADYADLHLATFDTRLGDDYVLGPLWADSVRNIRGLLNGETGRLDFGTLDGLLLAMLNLEGFR